MKPDIQRIIANMTLEEKAALCTGASAWSTTRLERLGVPEMIVSDGPHGVRRVPEVDSVAQGSLPATCFPTCSGRISSSVRSSVRFRGNHSQESLILAG